MSNTWVNGYPEREFKCRAFKKVHIIHGYYTINPDILNEKFLKKKNNIKCVDFTNYEDIHRPIVYTTPLVWATKNGYLTMVKFLVKNNAKRLSTAISWAVCSGHLDIVNFLLENGADITFYDNYTLRVAIRQKCLDTVKFLLNTFIYTEEYVHELANTLILNEEIKELLINYKQFSHIII